MVFAMESQLIIDKQYMVWNGEKKNMYRLGIDIGTATVKFVLIDENKTIITVWETLHHNQPSAALKKGIAAIHDFLTEEVAIGVTGADGLSFHKILKDSVFFEDVPAIVEGTKLLAPSAHSIMEIEVRDLALSRRLIRCRSLRQMDTVQAERAAFLRIRCQDSVFRLRTIQNLWIRQRLSRDCLVDVPFLQKRISFTDSRREYARQIFY